MKSIRLVMMGAILSILVSCTTYRTFTLDVLRPALVTPSYVNNKVLFINNTIPQPADVGHYFVGVDNRNTDTTYVIPCKVDSFFEFLMQSLSYRIEKEGVIQTIEKSSVVEKGISTKTGASQKGFYRVDSLTGSQLDYFKSTTTASVFVVLDGLLLESLESNIQASDLSSQRERVVYSHSVWSIFDNTADSMLLKFQFKDSVSWYENVGVFGKSKRYMPALESTLPIVADNLAEKVYRAFTPYWEPTERFYYVDGNISLKLAADDVRVGNWEKAASKWEYAYVNGKGLNPFKASVNMMLSCERVGDVDGALMWAKRAEVAANNGLFIPPQNEWDAYRAWQADLMKRKEELERIIPYLD